VSAPQPSRGLVERRELPRGVWGRAPAKNGSWRVLKATERSFLYLYDKIRGGQFAGPDLLSAGPCSEKNVGPLTLYLFSSKKTGDFFSHHRPRVSCQSPEN